MEGLPSVQSYSLYDVGPGSPLLAGLSGGVREELPEDTITNPSAEVLENRIINVLEVSERMNCTACQCTFDTREEQKEHYTLDWHRFNLKRRIRAAAPVSAEDFQEKTHAGDVSSISGSDSESSEDDEVDMSPEHSADKALLSSPGYPGRSHRALFRNSQGQLLSMYRCVLGESKNTDVTPEHLLSCVKRIQEQPVSVILMAGGGHFAGAVYTGKDVLKHKTFHRYTVRAKRGTSQAVHDAQNRSHMAKSAGAALRRYNQAALITDINELLQSWAEHLAEARGIFLRAPRTHWTLFLGRNSPIPKKDPRVHGIPFITRRATFREVQRIHAELFKLQVYEKSIPISFVTGARVREAKPRRTVEKVISEVITDNPDLSEEEEPAALEDLVAEELTLSTLDLKEFDVEPKRKRTRKKKKDAKVTGSESTADLGEMKPNHVNKDFEEIQKILDVGDHTSILEADELDRVRNVLYTCCRTGDSDTVTHVLWHLLPNSLPRSPSAGSLTAVDVLRLVNERLSAEQRTLLHVAAASGHGEMACLLMDAGWDPTFRDSMAQTPYSLSPDKVTRNCFRKYREDHPERYNYSKSQIPEPVSMEAEARRAEKKRAQKAQRKQKEKEEKEVQLRKEREDAEKRKFTALSDREKRALAAERRLAAQLKNKDGTESNARRCWQCGESLLGKVPFEYLDFSFCTTRCLQDHRRAKAVKP